MKIIILILLLLLLQGCSEKLVYIKPKPFNFQTTTQPKIRAISVYNDDKKLYEAYVLNFRSIIDFHNQQIEDYKKSFEDNSTKAE